MFFRKKRYFRYRFNGPGMFFVAQWTSCDGSFGEDFLRSGKALRLTHEKLEKALKDKSYEWHDVKN